MVENVTQQDPVQNRDVSAEEVRRLVSLAKQDMTYITAVICVRQQYSSLFIMSLRIDDFTRRPTARTHTFHDCFVCTAEPIDKWTPFGRVVYEAVGLHCEDHADVFHYVCGDSSICCTPEYHPDREYAWRAEGRELLARANEAYLEEPVTPSNASSQH